MTYRSELPSRTRTELLDATTCIATWTDPDEGRRIHDILVSAGLPATIHIVSPEEFDRMDEDAPGTYYVHVPAHVATAFREARKSPDRPKNRGIKLAGWGDYEWLAAETARRVA